MKRYRYAAPATIVVVLLVIVLIRARGATVPFHSETALMMDTLAEVSVWGKAKVSPEVGVDSALATMSRIDRTLGDARLDARANRALLESAEIAPVVEVSRRVYDWTGGLFDPTIGSVSRLWTYGENARLPDPDSIAAGLRFVGFARYLAARDSAGFVLDLGGVAKGFAVDQAAASLARLGFTSAIVSAGGDMRLMGRRPDGKPWRIAIRHPRREGDFIGYLTLTDAAVSTSGDYERCFFVDGHRYHHILDPRTGMPSEASTSVTVVAKTAVISDALSTGLFLLGPREGLRLLAKLEGVEAVFVYADGESLVVSPGLEGRFEKADLE